MARRHFRGFGNFGSDHASIAGPLIGGGATQLGIMLAHLHAKKNPKALRHAGLHGAVLGGLVGTALALSSKYRQTGISALVTVGIMSAPRLLEGFMGLGHRQEQLKEAEINGFGVITPEEYHALSGADDPAVQLLDSGSGGTGFGTHVAEEYRPLGAANDIGVELLGNGFGSNFLTQQ